MYLAEAVPGVTVSVTSSFSSGLPDPDGSPVPSSTCCLLRFQGYVTCLVFPKAVLDLF